ncbi:hypothetical protein HYZ78_03355 [Candidatus Microgenomates bacterium]|nr:hypothetical protein [Candidatus Microgenomates bacterium]
MISRALIPFLALAALVIFLAINRGSIQLPTPQQTTNQDNQPLPEGVAKFLDEEKINQFVSGGFKIYNGSTPPDLNNKIYMLDDLTLISMISGNSAFRKIGDKLEDYLYGFFNQTANGTIELETSAPGANGTSTKGFITGEDSCFTVYAEQEVKEYDCRFRYAKLVSACVQEEGLVKFEMLLHIIEHLGTTICAKAELPGHTAIYEERDGLGTKINPPSE